MGFKDDWTEIGEAWKGNNDNINLQLNEEHQGFVLLISNNIKKQLQRNPDSDVSCDKLPDYKAFKSAKEPSMKVI